MFTTNVFLSYSICYCMYFAMLWFANTNKSSSLVDEKGVFAQNGGKLLGLHIAGILWLGLVPLIWLNPLAGQVFGNKNPEWIIMLLFCFVFCLMVLITILQAKGIPAPAQINRAFTDSFYGRYFLLRSLFLISYELFFRGYLFFLCIDKLGIAMAIAINSLLTVLLHIFSKRKIMWACVPFSVISCWLNMQAHAVWPSILLHLAVSFCYETYTIKKLSTHLKTAS